MKPFNGYKAEKAAPREHLPAGGMWRRSRTPKRWNTAGEGCWWSPSRHRGGGEKRVLRGGLPQPAAGGQKVAWHLPAHRAQGRRQRKRRPQQATFGGAMWAIENSNQGYHWDWNAGLEGQAGGGAVPGKEWEMNGNTGWFTECCAFTDAASIRAGSFRDAQAQTPGPEGSPCGPGK